MNKTAVLLYPQFSEYELSVALSILMQGGKSSITVGLNNQPIKGESGLSCIADATVDEINFEEIDSLLLPGCMDIMSLIDEDRLTAFIQRVTTKETVIASISSSPYLLAKAGVLGDTKFTVGMTKENMEKSGVFEKKKFSEEIVVQDGNIITPRGRGFIRFGICFGKALNLEFDERWYQE
ncbi:4-methyl-5(B-hydroxyethyl)-thiazole monophosphate biosynthesis protein [Sporosarcina sp. ANT_H38]|uniref:DJ-1/PfpI family protein n=1 Tax=Sporosarcina sp. ANT_H38 TaxID=2597358 RepID=UPI0011F3B2C8|nr:DJ-1/PfpI family protein [Sporosarcina sp. ANT_H38]KAA0965431.1 4-methyl-5(B-hydroxyethyl)-thiazole monophosphate biosynthesis protein [Sporosarcina sp. ANT_H38]